MRSRKPGLKSYLVRLLFFMKTRFFRTLLEITGTIDQQGNITVTDSIETINTCPICLPSWTLIDTPTGAVPVSELQAGAMVWTVDDMGRRVQTAILATASIPTPPNHMMIDLHLDDGRNLLASPDHPIADGTPIAALHTGDLLDGSVVRSVGLVPYSGTATYDILPGGPTGLYWANGILVRSTLTEFSPVTTK